MLYTLDTLPSPITLPILGSMLEVDTGHVVASFRRLARAHGPIFRLTLPSDRIHIVSSHALAKELSDTTRFQKALSAPLVELRMLGGDGLFTAYNHEPNWAKAHRLLMPAFGTMALPDYFEPMLDIIEQMLTRWERFGPEEVHDVPDQWTRLTLDTLALCAFNFRFNSFYQEGQHEFVDAMLESLIESSARTKRPAVLNSALVHRQRALDEALDVIQRTTEEVVQKRKAMHARGEQTPQDLLERMLVSADPVTGEKLSDENIRHQLVTFLIAGHETTSGLLSYATHYLLDNPVAMKRLRDEVDEILEDRIPIFSDVARLTYTEQVLRESLRLSPTAPAFGVEAIEDTTLAGKWEVPAGSKFLLLLPEIHRDPRVWHKPEVFDPERFSPENIGKIPDRAWMPFGNGPRACIGSQFAMQEAKLALSMLVQRFDLERPAPYTLHEKEALTTKPADLYVRARKRRDVVQRNTTVSTSAPHADKSKETEITDAHQTPLLVLFGSNAGSAEAVARKLAATGAARGWDASAKSLDAQTGELPDQGAVILVSASYNGNPPDNARTFVSWLKQQPEGAFENTRFAVLGCGHRDWASTYQAIPKLLDSEFERCGATRITPRGEADAAGDFFGTIEQWSEQFWDAANDLFSLDAKDDHEALYQVEPVGARQWDEWLSRRSLLESEVLENRELVDMNAPFARSKRHLEIALPENSRYHVGDYVSVLPENPPELVARAARVLHVKQNDVVVVRAPMADASLPTEQPISVGELLARHVELAAPATRSDVARLAESNACPPHQAELDRLANDERAYQDEVFSKRLSLVELLERFPASAVSFANALEMLPAMRRRRYSIASSPTQSSSQCSLTVSVLDAPAWSGEGRHKGIASNYLAKTEPGDKLTLLLERPTKPFYPPEDHATPMILIGAGSGIAPFRGFLQELAHRGEGSALLFFGCDHPEVDFLYHQEWEPMVERGLLEVFPAFSEGPDEEHRFVQHAVWRASERVRALVDEGAVVYVCGDGRHMEPAVYETLARILSESDDEGDSSGVEKLEALVQQGRYLTDVFA